MEEAAIEELVAYVRVRALTNLRDPLTNLLILTTGEVALGQIVKRLGDLLTVDVVIDRTTYRLLVDDPCIMIEPVLTA